MRVARLLIAATAAAAALSAPVAAADPTQPTAVGRGGAAASVDHTATQAAVDVMRRGGNAFDAAVAAASVLGVTEPFSCGIGGGGFMVLRDGATGRVTTIDSREKAPAAIQPSSFFLDGRAPDPNSAADFALNRYSGLSAGVPGTAAAWDYVLRRWGTWSLRRALGYGARVARRGFSIDTTFFNQVQQNAAYFDDVPSTAELYLDADGTPRDVGTLQRNPDLAGLYERVGRLGAARGFYRGAVAQDIVGAVRRPPVAAGAEHVWRPGLMTARDLRRYHAVRRAPVHIRYDGLDVYGMGPPSSGGSTVLEALNLLASVKRANGGSLGTSRAQILHRYLEASRLAYADRNAFLADPSFFAVPLRGLLSPGYADQRAALIGPRAARSPVAPGDPRPFDGAAAATVTHPGDSTTHLSVADADGNIVAYTFTIEQIGGNGIVVPGRGFLLNNELTDFNTESTSAANRAEGGKRPRSSIAPIVIERDGRPMLTVGSPGGATIITTVLQVLLNRLEFHDPLPQAIAAPRASQRNGARTEAEAALQASPAGRQLVSEFGQTFSTPAGNGELGAATGIEYTRGGRLIAAAEPTRRGGGSAAVVK